MNFKGKTGVVLLLFSMMAILLVIWYCLFAAGHRSSYIDGTFVRHMETEETELEMAA